MSPDEITLPPEMIPPTQIEPAPPATQPRGIAPIWHTVVLVLAIICFSIWGAQRSNSGDLNPLAPVHRPTPAASAKGHAGNSNEGADPMRLLRYALSGGLELTVVAWIAFGMRLRKIPFRSLFGALPRGLNNVTTEVGIAALFWICSMAILLTVALTWQAVETQVYRHQLKQEKQAQSASPSTPPATESKSPHPPAAEPKSPQQKQAETIRQLMQLAPANGFEIAAWGCLCLVVGFSEELVFRGYLQSQSIALLHRTPIAVLLTSLIFGAAHGYQGLRGMCIITMYGALFSVITLLRRNLFPGMIAHGWHDFFTGLILALIRSTHLIDRLSTSS